MTELLEAARDAYGRHEWSDARNRFLAARKAGELAADDLVALSDAAWWLGLVDESIAASEAAYRLYLQGERPRQAATAAMDIAVNLFLRGDGAVGSGWMSRAQRLLADLPDNVEHGYARYLLDVEAAFDGDDLDSVLGAARRVRDAGNAHSDANLVALGILGEGRVLVRQGRVAGGMALLDEAMVAVLSDALDPVWAGNIYCHLMAACHELVDIRRAREWTEATARWLDGLPPAVLFTGICRVHRSQVMQVSGDWQRAEAEALQVCRDLADIHVAGAAEAHYQVGEIRRLRGDLAAADRAYRRAHRLGRDPQPGLALLRLAQGRVEAASASIRAALTAEPFDRLARARLCAAQVEIALAAGDVESARKAGDELDETAAHYGSSGLGAAARQARGTILLADGHAAEALPELRAACLQWRELDADYAASKVRVLLADAYQVLGDDDGAALEREAARASFDRLGATLDARALGEPAARPAAPGGLTARESQVLAYVAAGRSNREVAAALIISEKTVGRHLSNIFTKLGLRSRTEAAAYAFERGLVSPGPA